VAWSPTAELDPEVLGRLGAYTSEFMGDFGLIVRRYWAEVYLQGLLLDGERKSIQPLAQRVNVPGWCGDTEQALQQFVNQSPWDEHAVLRTYRRLLGAALADPRVLSR
jgi:SRSO17 transposase